MANTVENVLTLLGVLRAGLIAMPLPLLWRRADAVAALRRVGADRLDRERPDRRSRSFRACQEIAAEIFSIRYVCVLAPTLPTAWSRSTIFSGRKLDPIPAWEEERGREPGPWRSPRSHHLGRFSRRACFRSRATMLN